jgi:8-oxo-dGTP pyrophosphatase MutT (NUDIX family)
MKVVSGMGLESRARVRAGVGVIIRDSEGRILMEKRRDCGLWGTPGGKIEPGESVAAAAIRETREETGLTIEVTRLLGVYSNPDTRIVMYPDNGDVVHLVDILLEARVIGGQLACSPESEEVRFVHPHEVSTELVPAFKGPLADFLSGHFGIIR